MTNCPSLLELERFAAGELDDETRRSVAGHADGCPACREQLDELAADDQLASEVSRVLIDPAGLVDPGPARSDLVAGYRIEREIGRGGMGVVYEAVQERPRRRVALKIMDPGRASARLRRRLEHEAEILGRLRHPGIAQIFAAGTFESPRGERPYFAMELVRGRGLLEHVELDGLDSRARIELLIQLCDAIQHAHQQGVIHRDLKPSNILVDESGQPKVLDFGVALAESMEVSRLDTRSGQLVGTLAYMSPEQASGDVGGIDTRSDVYALGVVAYEVLTGSKPHELLDTTITNMIQRICESDPRPLGQLEPSLAGDVELIVHKALAKDKADRYASAAELASDLARFLAHEPISARPPTTFYQLRRFARRNRALVGGVAATFAALVVGMITTWTQWTRAADAEATAVMAAAAAERSAQEADEKREEAERLLREAQAAREFLQEVLILASPNEQGHGSPTIERVLEIALDRVDAQLGSQPLVQAAVRHTLGRVLLAMEKYETSEQQLSRSLELYEKHGSDACQVVQVLANLTDVQIKRGDYDAAEETVNRALELCRRVGKAEVLLLVEVLGSLGSSHYAKARLPRAEQTFRRVLRLLELVEPESKRLANIAVYNGHLAATIANQNRFDEASELYETAIAQQRELLGAESPFLASTLRNYATLARRMGEHAKAEGLYREAIAILVRKFGEESTDAASARQGFARLLFENGKRSAALEMMRTALDTLRKQLGVHPTVVHASTGYAELLELSGDYAAARKAYEAALATGLQRPGREHALTNVARGRLGALLVRLGDLDQADKLLTEALALYRDKLAWMTDRAKAVNYAYGVCLLRRNRFAEAEEPLTLAARDYAGDQRMSRNVGEALVTLYEKWEKPAKAAEMRARLGKQ